MNKKTEDLLNLLKIENNSYDAYLNENQDTFLDNDISHFWKKIIASCGMKKTDIINKADIGYSFFYDILKGNKHPSRDTLIKLLIVLSCDLDVFQEALRLYEWAALYPKIKRDSIIIYAINHNYSLYQTEELLQNNNEKVLNFYE
ncbi:MAG: hypothetical protein ACI4VW_09740 [Acutalibacteraceae bacterium]